MCVFLALKFCEDLSKIQPVNSDLKPFRAFLDDVATKQPPRKLKSVLCVCMVWETWSKLGETRRLLTSLFIPGRVVHAQAELQAEVGPQRLDYNSTGLDTILWD